MQKKIDIQNPIIGNLLSQVNANKISDAEVKQLLNLLKKLPCILSKGLNVLAKII